MFKLKAKKAFRDKLNPKTVFKVGDTLETNDVDRVNSLVVRGLCEIVGVVAPESPASGEKVVFQEKEYDVAVMKKALQEVGAPVANNAGVNGVNKTLEELTEELTTKLVDCLNTAE